MVQDAEPGLLVQLLGQVIASGQTLQVSHQGLVISLDQHLAGRRGPVAEELDQLLIRGRRGSARAARRRRTSDASDSGGGSSRAACFWQPSGIPRGLAWKRIGWESWAATCGGATRTLTLIAGGLPMLD